MGGQNEKEENNNYNTGRQITAQKGINKDNIEAAFKTLLSQQGFSSSQSALDRAQQESLQKSGFTQQSSESEKAYQRAMDQLKESQGFTGSEAEKQRQQEKSLLGEQQSFSGEQAQLGRAQESSEAEKAYQRVMAQLKEAQGFQSGESSLGRQQEKDILSQQQGFVGSESEKDRALKQALIGGQVERGQNLLNSGEAEINDLNSNALPELAAMTNDIKTNATAAQEEQRRQLNAQLAQQGVRGGQAATLLGRASGNLAQKEQQDVNTLAYNDFLERRKARTAVAGQKAQTGANAYAGSV